VVVSERIDEVSLYLCRARNLRSARPGAKRKREVVSSLLPIPPAPCLSPLGANEEANSPIAIGPIAAPLNSVNVLPHEISITTAAAACRSAHSACIEE